MNVNRFPPSRASLLLLVVTLGSAVLARAAEDTPSSTPIPGQSGQCGGEGIRHTAPAGSLPALGQAGPAGHHRLRCRHRGASHPDQCPRRALCQPGADPGHRRRGQDFGDRRGGRAGNRSGGAEARRRQLLCDPRAARARQHAAADQGCRARLRLSDRWHLACPSPRASSRVSSSCRTTIRPRDCGSRSTRPSIRATAADRRSRARR